MPWAFCSNLLYDSGVFEGDILLVQAATEDIFGNETCEHFHVKEEDVKEFGTLKVITREESTKVELEGQHSTETGVQFGLELNSYHVLSY